ncbi:GntR family transcriptional regulator [Candidimonas humi]|uniref:GntR family transcriptional regulator n=1 Tax=Candidimonas humi TaxID=683355 RepID=A0ABV8P122_9BURK|nr:GntR family transcriptional regulator [Candidimonas humi]MBV6305703.1 GntR family transcriptional regulator [Candidimonas humi]
MRTNAPKYVHVADLLAKEISSGYPEVGALLPKESDLIARFNVSRTTIREALKRLSALGLIETIHGVGTRVIARQQSQSFMLTSRSVSELVSYGTGATRFRVLRRESLTLRPEDAPIFKMPAGSATLRLMGQRVNKADLDQVISICRIYVRKPYLAAVAQDREMDEAVYTQICRAFDMEIQKIEQEIQAVFVSPDEAELLRATPYSPALQVVRRYFFEDEEPFEVTVNTYPGHNFTYKLTLNRTSNMTDA